MPDLSLFARPNETIYLLAHMAERQLHFYGTPEGPMGFLSRERAEAQAAHIPGARIVERTFAHMIHYCHLRRCHLTLQLASGWTQLFSITTSTVEGISFGSGEQPSSEVPPTALPDAEQVRDVIRRALMLPIVGEPWKKAHLN